MCFMLTLCREVISSYLIISCKCVANIKEQQIDANF